MMKGAMPSRMLRLGIALMVAYVLLIGGSSLICERLAGERLVKHQCVLQHVDEGSVAVRRRSRTRYVYHFNAEVEVNGQTIHLTPGNARQFSRKYNQGDIVPVYELDGRYSFNRSELIIPRLVTVLGSLQFGAGLALIMMSFFIWIVRKVNELKARRAQS